MSRNTGNNGNNDSGARQEGITSIKKLVFMVMGGSAYLIILLLGWQVYVPEPWLPMPSVGTFIAVSTLVFLFWIIVLNMIEVIDAKKKPGAPPR